MDKINVLTKLTCNCMEDGGGGWGMERDMNKTSGEAGAIV